MDQQLWQVIFPFLYGKQKGPFNEITLFLPFTSISVKEPYHSTIKDSSFPFLTPPHLVVSLPHCIAGPYRVPFLSTGCNSGPQVEPPLALSGEHWTNFRSKTLIIDLLPTDMVGSSLGMMIWISAWENRQAWLDLTDKNLSFWTTWPTKRQWCDRMNIFWRKASWGKPWRLWVAKWQGQKITLGRWKIWPLKLSYPCCPKIYP